MPSEKSLGLYPEAMACRGAGGFFQCGIPELNIDGVTGFKRSRDIDEMSKNTAYIEQGKPPCL